MSRQKRPSGPAWPTPQAWKTWIETVMAEKGVTQADLYREIGASPTAVSDLFNPRKDVQQSRLVPRIHRALGLPPPLPPSPRKGEERDALLRELQEAWRDLSDEDKTLLMGIVRRVKARPSGSS